MVHGVLAGNTVNLYDVRIFVGSGRMRLKNALKNLRKDAKLTQQQLGDLVEVSRKTINTVENDVFCPSKLLSLKLAKALNVNVEDIFWLTDSAESPEP